MSTSPPRAVSPTHELSRQEKIFTLVGVLLGMLLAALDQTIVATAGPAIQRDLAIPASLYAWITTAYMVASTVLVPIYGKLSDLFGRKPILLVGVGLFLAGSLLCALSRSPTALILSRAVQGVGSASLFTSAFAVVADIFPPAVRGRYTGIFGGVWGLASVVGPFVGGVLTDRLSWHWVFLVNLPVGAVAVAFIVLRMPRLRPAAARPGGVDVLGALALVVAVVPLLLALSLGRSRAAGALAPRGAAAALIGGGYPWTSGPILLLFALAVAGGVAFVLVERHAADPLLDLRLFRNPVFAWGNAAVFTVGATFLAAIVFLPLFMVNVVGLSATASGLTMTPLTLGLVAGNVLSGQIVSRLGRYRRPMLAALLLLMIAFGLMGWTLDTTATQGQVTLKMILVGLGLGPSIPIYTLIVQNGVLPSQIGVATASATFFRQLGSTVGVALLGTVFANVLVGRLAEDPGALAPAFAAATRSIYQVALGIVVLGALLTARIPELPLRKTNT
jgi:EmrB/QacA subfamily drug resistance transporter